MTGPLDIELRMQCLTLAVENAVTCGGDPVELARRFHAFVTGEISITQRQKLEAACGEISKISREIEFALQPLSERLSRMTQTQRGQDD